MILPDLQMPNANLQLEDKKRASRPSIANCKSQIANPEPPKAVRRNGLMFNIPQPNEQLPEAKPAKSAKPKEPKVKRKCDPRLASAARELRDRWLEQINDAPLLPSGKYAVTRAIGTAAMQIEIAPSKLLEAA